MQHLVFDGQFIRAEMTLVDRNQTSTKLAVVFDCYDPARRGFGHLAPLKTALAAGYDCLTVTTSQNDWFINCETAAFEGVLFGLTHGLKDVRAFGMSMGGYAALRFAPSMRACFVCAVSPQASMDDEWAAFDDRYTVQGDGFDAKIGALRPTRLGEVGGVIYVDPFDTKDLAHANEIKRVAPGVEICRLAGGGHPAHKTLRAAGEPRLINQIAFASKPDPKSVVRQHNEIKDQTQHYWRGLRARVRDCRPGLSNFADTRLREIRTAA